MPAARPSPAPIQVDIVSDIVCPWCWLGATYFRQAAAQFSGETVLKWRPYMLDPDVPEGGVPNSAYMKAKFGDAPSSRFTAMRTHLEAAGPEAGIDFRFTGIPMRPNTMGAHRVLRWAGGQGRAGAAADLLFRAFFTEHKDVGDPKVLIEIAERAGLDSAIVADLLRSDKDSAEIKTEIAHFRQLGVSSVPTFIYNGQFAIQGAQPAHTHLKALTQAHSAAPAAQQ